MGFYWQTIFYKNIHSENLHHDTNFVVLSSINKIIDKDDIERGYIRKDDLLKYCSKLDLSLPVTEADIGDGSYIVEYQICTLDYPPETVETRRMKVI